ncbi:MAG: glycosyltransferase [Chitinophagaceae bacterium]
MKKIFFTVTNDLTYDQRMHRICYSLSANGYQVFLVGRKLSNSLPLDKKPFSQKRLRCFFHKGPFFYAEYNLRLFFFLLFKKMHAICAVDLDTILPCLFISKLKGISRTYDAHEYFTELKEVRTRPGVKKIWTVIEKFSIPKFHYCYTVSEGLAEAFKNEYKIRFETIRNFPVLYSISHEPSLNKYLFYGGAVNEGRGFEYLIPAMKYVDLKLIIAGDGNYMAQLKELIKKNYVEDKVELLGMITPQQLKQLSEQATLGIGLAEKEGINQYLALPNKFLDYMHAGLPQLAMNYPEYRTINHQYNIAILIDELSVEIVSENINEIVNNEQLLRQMRKNCLRAKEVFNWQNEEQKLIRFYKTIFRSE